MSVSYTHLDVYKRQSSACSAARRIRRRHVEHVEVQFFVEHGGFGLRRAHEQVSRHADEDAVVASRVITQKLSLIHI